MNQITEKTILGKLIILLMGMYGVHIYGQFSLFNSKGILPSTFVVLWLLFVVLFLLNNTALQIVSRSVLKWHKLILIQFLLYYLINILFQSDKAFSANFTNYLSVVIPGFLLGVTYCANYDKFELFNKIARSLNSDAYAKKIYWFAGISSLIFLFYQAYLFYINKFGLTLKFATLDDMYYQDIGDYFVIFYCGLLALRENYRSRLAEKYRSYILFTIFMIVELAISVIFLQLIGSNKAPLTVMLIGLSYLFFSVPKAFKLRLRQILSIVFLLASSIFLINAYLEPEFLNGLRVFGDMQSKGIENNSSFTVRLDQFIESGYDQMSRNWIFGDLSLNDYIHSSLVSIQTHLGFIGSLLFWSFLAAQSYIIYVKSEDRIAKAITIPIVFVSIISSAFWWLPLWFVAGLIYMRR